MAQVKKIVLSSSRDVPFDKLVLSQSNVRRIKAGVSIEELAEDIARRTLLQSITVRPVVDADGVETGMFEIPAGGRRYRALELLVKQKRLARNAPVPCVVRTSGIPEEDSLAENVQRAPLHPLDQFRAFLALREKGQSEEEIAAAFFVTVAVVKQRLRLASVSPKLLDVYADDGMKLDQLMAFTVNGDHQRQEQVFDRLAQSYDKQPTAIRRMLTESTVRAADKRALLVGHEAYLEAGGIILRDLFHGDDGGWLQDVGLLDRLVAEKLEQAADAVRSEGWRWIEVATDFPYMHTYGLRRLRGEQPALTKEQLATRDALQADLDELEETYSDADDVPDDVDGRLADIEAAITAIDDRPMIFDAEEIARAGVFISIDGSGSLRVDRGYIRPEDERPIAPEPEIEEHGGAATVAAHAARVDHSGDSLTADLETTPEPDEDDGMKPIPDRLMSELTAHRTLALRHAVGENPHIAFLAALHALTLRVFYRYAQDTCLELDMKSTGFAASTPGLTDGALAASFDARQTAWSAALPKEPTDLWDALAGFDGDSRQALFAHCVSLSINAVYEPYNRRPRALAHADRLAEAVDLDMVAAGWTPSAATYLGRVTKAQILAAVREAKGTRAGDRIEHLKKVDMAERAEDLLAGSGWLPEPLRTPGRLMATSVMSAVDTEGSRDAVGNAIGDDIAEAGAAVADVEPRARMRDDATETDVTETDGHAIAAE